MLPTAIPENIVIDISKLMMGENIHLNDVVLPAGVTVKSSVNFTICAMEALHDDQKRGKRHHDESECLGHDCPRLDWALCSGPNLRARIS